jgi:hypothetical protein
MSTVERCPGCGAEIDSRQVARAGACSSRSCRRKLANQRERERLKTQRAAAATAARAAVAPLGARLGVAEPDRVPVVVLPANTRRLQSLPASRRRAFRANLLEAIAAATQRRVRARRAPGASPDGGVPPAIAAGCATCAGFCCRLGAEHAFLDADAIRRYVQRTGTTGVGAITRAFLRHLPAVSYQSSCVYHAASGCSLPREMRAEICNRFYCGPLREHWTALAELGERRAVLAAADAGSLVRLAVVNGTGQRRPVATRRSD